MKLHTYYRGSPVHMLKRPELIEAAEMAVSSLHLTNLPSFDNLHTRGRSVLIAIIGVAADLNKIIWDKHNGNNRT